MMEKLFAAKVVGVNNYMLSVMLFAAIGGFVVLLLVMLTPIDGQYAGYIFLGIIVVSVIAVLFSKQELSVNNLDDDFFVYEDHLEIGRIIFPLSEITNLEFLFRSFLRMKKGTYQINPDADFKKKIEDGMSNTVSLCYKNQLYNYPFFIHSQQHFHLFVQMLEKLYTNQVNFSEKNWYGKTFLMQNVTEERYQELKRAYV